MFAVVVLWWSRLLDRAHQVPSRHRDRGSNTTETVIWIAALATLALVVAALFGQRIYDAATNVSFQ